MAAPNWIELRQTNTTPNTQNDPVDVVIDCPHEDNAIEIAIYMVDEIQRNAVSEAANLIKANNAYDATDEIEKWHAEFKKQSLLRQFFQAGAMPDFPQMQLAARGGALLKWTETVAQNRPWDHKPIIAARFPTNGKSTRFHHKYKDYEYYYDIWSNVHYGYIGAYCGFSTSVLLDGAGLEQIGSDIFRGQAPQSREAQNGAGLRKFDDTTDSLSVALGIKLFETYPNPNNLDATTLMEAIAQVPYPIREGSKIPHSCADAYK